MSAGSVWNRLCSITARTIPAVASGRSVSELLLVAILEGVHLLRDDVGLGADAAREQLRLLEDGRADLAVAVALEHLARRRLDALPGRVSSGRMSFVPLTAWIIA